MTAKQQRRGFGRLRKLPSGRWQAAYTYGGETHRAPSTFPAKSYAEGWLSAELLAIDTKTWRSPQTRAATKAETKSRAGITFADYANLIVEERTTPGHENPLRPTSAREYETQLRLRLVPEFGHLPLTEITAEHITAWYRAEGAGKPVDGRQAKGGLRARAKAYQVLSAILNAAVDDPRTAITVSPCKIRGAGGSGGVRDVELLTTAELEALAAAMPDRLKLAVLFGGWLALRYGEVFELRRGDVVLDPPNDPVQGVVKVRRAVTWTRGAIHHGPPKTAAGKRDVAIPPHILPTVVAHLKSHVGSGSGALLFPNRTGGNLRPSSFEVPWLKARTAISREDLHFHDLRHIGLTWAAHAGATIKELLARGGHTKPEVAIRYQEIAQGRDQQLAAALSNLAN